MKNNIRLLLKVAVISAVILLGVKAFTNVKFSTSKEVSVKQIYVNQEGFNFYPEIDSYVTYDKDKNEILLGSPLYVINNLDFDSRYVSYNERNKRVILGFKGSYLKITTPNHDVFTYVPYNPVDINNQKDLTSLGINYDPENNILTPINGSIELVQPLNLKRLGQGEKYNVTFPYLTFIKDDRAYTLVDERYILDLTDGPAKVGNTNVSYIHREGKFQIENDGTSHKVPIDFYKGGIPFSDSKEGVFLKVNVQRTPEGYIYTKDIYGNTYYFIKDQNDALKFSSNNKELYWDEENSYGIVTLYKTNEK